PAHTVVEVRRLRLDPVGGPSQAGQAFLRVHVQEHGQVRNQSLRGPDVDLADLVHGQLPARALVSQGRIDVTVTDDHGSALQSGQDRLLDGGRPGRGGQQRLRARWEVCVRTA